MKSTKTCKKKLLIVVVESNDQTSHFIIISLPYTIWVERMERLKINMQKELSIKHRPDEQYGMRMKKVNYTKCHSGGCVIYNSAANSARLFRAFYLLHIRMPRTSLPICRNYCRIVSSLVSCSLSISHWAIDSQNTTTARSELKLYFICCLAWHSLSSQ